ncbi:MAG: hypothetical protein HY689_10120 [Chloroflexi bacterium]|nr:hypothetical protein [Chloroflexota bacterium]
MPVDAHRHHRRSIRLPGHDYVGGVYFITVCAHDRACLFGAIENGTVTLSEMGQMVEEEWVRSAQIRSELTIDTFVVMPNHVHGIVVLHAAHAGEGAGMRAPTLLLRRPRSLGSFIAGFKAATTKRINALRSTPGAPVWQRNYDEHIIRTERAWGVIRQYIMTNPQHWEQDREHPDRQHPPQR